MPQRLRDGLGMALAFVVLLLAACGNDPSPAPREVADAPVSVEAVAAFFASQGKTVLTFIGYSGAGYEDEAAMLAEARAALSRHDPRRTIVNIGATPDGIGAVYALAKELGYVTTGVVSTQAKEHGVPAAADCDHVFFVEDDTWGGFVDGSKVLSPTSQAMVRVSEEIVGIGGGDVGRDEMLAARELGKRVVFVPAEMDHERARAKARKKGAPEPSDFRGSAHVALSK